MEIEGPRNFWDPPPIGDPAYPIITKFRLEKRAVIKTFNTLSRLSAQQALDGNKSMDEHHMYMFSLHRKMGITFTAWCASQLTEAEIEEYRKGLDEEGDWSEPE